MTFGLLCFCTVFGSLFLPYFAPDGNSRNGKKSKSFLAPLKIFIPTKKLQADGQRRRSWSLTLLGVGAFFSVLATGYVPMGLQLVATNVFGFHPSDSGQMLVSLAITPDLKRNLTWRSLSTS